MISELFAKYQLGTITPLQMVKSRIGTCVLPNLRHSGAILRYSFCRGRDILNFHLFITLSIL